MSREGIKNMLHLGNKKQFYNRERKVLSSFYFGTHSFTDNYLHLKKLLLIIYWVNIS